jgi:hypothetical protein
MLVTALIAVPGAAGAAYAGQKPADATPPCLVEVLYSEEMPVGPLFYHTVRATLRVTPAGRSPFVTTVQRAIPWQAPPLRRGQRLKVSCDPALIDSSLRLFE